MDGPNTPHNSANPILTMKFLKLPFMFRHLDLQLSAHTLPLLLSTRLGPMRAYHAPWGVDMCMQVRLWEEEVKRGVTVFRRGWKRGCWVVDVQGWCL